jgi:hypothetical protein
MNKSRKVVSCLFLLFVILVSLLFSHFTSTRVVETMTNSCSVDTDCETDEKCIDNECVKDESTNNTSNDSNNDTSPSSPSTDNDNKENKMKNIKKLQSDKKKLDNKMKKIKDLVCNSKEGFATMNHNYGGPERPSSEGIFNHLFNEKQSSSFSLPAI